ncbi:23041_t:CDS:2, partial [Rhizophagus irregularis]
MSFPNPKPNETPDQYVTMEIDESIIIEGSSGKVVNSEKDSAEQELRNLPEFQEPEADQNNENPGDDDDGESESGISLDDDVTFLSDNETPVEQFTALTSTIIQN